MMRRFLHAILVLLGVPLWCIGVSAFGSILMLARAADRLWPDADKGNCWSFTLPRWYEHGGYMAIRWAKGRVRFFGMRIPHAIWLPEMPPDCEVEQALPLRRSRGRIIPNVVYFRFKVSRSDASH